MYQFKQIRNGSDNLISICYRDLGGTLNMDHEGWLKHCLEIVEKKEGELTTMSSSQPTSPTSSSTSSSMAGKNEHKV